MASPWSGPDARVTFEAYDAADLSLSGQHDLAVIVEALHDVSRPVDVLAGVRRLRAPGGTLIVADAFYAPADDTDRLFYGYRVLYCTMPQWLSLLRLLPVLNAVGGFRQ